MGGIVAAVDNSPGARAALAWAVGGARLRGAALGVVHVHKPEEWTAPVYFPSQHAAPAVPLGAAGEPSQAELAGVLQAQQALREAARGRAEALLDELLGEVGVAGWRCSRLWCRSAIPSTRWSSCRRRPSCWW
jgi:nucleotide-binding universal stress UspA family protein